MSVSFESRAKIDITHVGSSRQHEEPDQNDNHIQYKSRNAPESPLRGSTWSMGRSPHPKICYPPEDEPKEGIEEGAHESKQIGEERNDLGDDESYDPCYGQDGSPRYPADHGVLPLMSGTFEDSEEDEPSRD